MKFLDKTGITHLWGEIKSHFLSLPSNNRVASAGTILFKTESGSEWKPVSGLSTYDAGGFLIEKPFTVDLVFANSGNSSLLGFTPLLGQSREYVRGELKGDQFNVERIEIQRIPDRRFNLHFKAGIVCALDKIESIANSLIDNGWSVATKI